MHERLGDKVRILLVANGLPPREWAGVELDTYHLALSLADRHEVWLYVRASDRSRPEFAEWDECVGKLRVRRVINNFADPGNFIGFFRVPQIDRQFRRYVDEIRPDVVHFQHLIGLSATLPAVTYSQDIPSLLTLHDYWWVCPRVQLLRGDLSPCPGPSHHFDCVGCLTDHRVAPAIERRTALQRLRSAIAYQLKEGTSFPHLLAILGRRALEVPFERAPTPSQDLASRLRLHDYRLHVMQHLLRYPDVITAPSRYVRDLISREFDLPAERIRIVPLGIPPLPTEMRRDPAGKIRFCYVGTVAPHKGVHVLIEAAGRLRDAPIEVHIYGADGNLPQYLNKLYALDRSLVYHGPYQRTELSRIFSQTDVLVLPSLWAETFSIIIREAAMAGVPVIASRVGAIPEFIQDGKNGLLVTPGSVDELASAMNRLISDSTLRQRLGTGHPQVRDLEEYTREIEEIYESISLAPVCRPSE
ncbi:MAG TPA: glycosyltransferase [Chloroflexota bacterium]|nr:glycosyltransferase [Chloroflexota bacterium]